MSFELWHIVWMQIFGVKKLHLSVTTTPHVQKSFGTLPSTREKRKVSSSPLVREKYPSIEQDTRVEKKKISTTASTVAPAKRRVKQKAMIEKGISINFVEEEEELEGPQLVWRRSDASQGEASVKRKIYDIIDTESEEEIEKEKDAFQIYMRDNKKEAKKASSKKKEKETSQKKTLVKGKKKKTI